MGDFDEYESGDVDLKEYLYAYEPPTDDEGVPFDSEDDYRQFDLDAYLRGDVYAYHEGPMGEGYHRHRVDEDGNYYDSIYDGIYDGIY